ncbi:MAG: hypothetical protein NNA20_00505 [Nitrospira sp.]|nr:hypothetical protein [Nitrospira sp.]MCP9441049.1 hypothetical protein [Nitrospira sp.]
MYGIALPDEKASGKLYAVKETDLGSIAIRFCSQIRRTMTLRLSRSWQKTTGQLIGLLQDATKTNAPMTAATHKKSR